RFGWDIARFAELLHWAEIIDGALFPSAAMAVELREPALRLMTWVENNREKALAERFIEDLVSRPLADIAATTYVAEALRPLLARHEQNLVAMRRLSHLDQGVAISDLIAEGITTINKFIVYYLHPEARYAVTLLETPERYKISVGSNPWPKAPRTHDIAKLCEKYGGGGHPAVGAISLPKTDLAAVRKVAGEIVTFLQNG
ncbi:MAG TPA: phosphoesterase, partial [Polyangia bacterium]